MSKKFYRICLCFILAMLLTAGCAVPPAQPVPSETIPTATEATVAPATDPTAAATAAVTEPTETVPAETEPEVVYTEVKETVYATQYVNVRVEPDASSRKYTHLEKGEAITRVGIGSNGWSQIIIAGDIVYVNSLYLTTKAPKKDDSPEVEEDVTPLGTVYAINDVDIRSGPGTNYKKVGTLKKGESLPYTSIGFNGWTKVIYKNVIRFIPSDQLTTVNPDVPTDTVPVATEPGETVPPTIAPTETSPAETTPPAVTEPTGSTSAHTHEHKVSKVVSPTCTEGGYTVYTCSCGDSYRGNETSAAGHAWGGWTVTKESTTEAEGKRERTCGTCGKKETESIPKKEGGDIDAESLAAFGNEYAESLGFDYDPDVRIGYFPPDTVASSTVVDAKENVVDNIMVMHDNLMAAAGTVEGFRVCVDVTENADGGYTVTVYYG